MDMKEILKSGIEQALQETINSGGLPAGEFPEIVLEVPPQKEFGDFLRTLLCNPLVWLVKTLVLLQSL